MSIQFARMRIISRSSGANVVRSAAYNARSHAHILLTTRKVDDMGMGEKARDLNGLFAKGYMMEREHWGEVWRDFQSDYFF